MFTKNEIWIKASPQRIYDLASDVANWPKLLPHYRWVRVLEDEQDIRRVEMAARRSIFPVRWTAMQKLFPEACRITYRHVRGVTTDMDVEWRLTPSNGGTQVVIEHDLNSRKWWLRFKPLAWIVGDFFVKGIAARTLHHIKLAAERKPGGNE